MEDDSTVRWFFVVIGFILGVVFCAILRHYGIDLNH